MGTKSKNKVSISTKGELLEFLGKLPDDTIIIHPVWGLHGRVRCATKKSPNPSMDVRLTLAQDILKDGDKSINSLMKLSIMPIVFVYGDKAKEALTDKAFELVGRKSK